MRLASGNSIEDLKRGQGTGERRQDVKVGGQGTGERSIAPQGAGARTHDSHTLAAVWCAHGSTGASS